MLVVLESKHVFPFITFADLSLSLRAELTTRKWTFFPTQKAVNNISVTRVLAKLVKVVEIILWMQYEWIYSSFEQFSSAQYVS